MILEPYGNHKPETYNRYIHTKRERKSITLKSSNHKGQRRDTKATRKKNVLNGLSRHLSIVTLNINGLSAPMKRNRVAEWIKKQDPSICCL